MPNSAISFNTSGLATTTSPGLVGTGAQTFAGKKTLDGGALIKGDTGSALIASGYVGQVIANHFGSVNFVSAGWASLASITLTSGLWNISGCVYGDRNLASLSVFNLAYSFMANGDTSNYSVKYNLRTSTQINVNAGVNWDSFIFGTPSFYVRSDGTNLYFSDGSTLIASSQQLTLYGYIGTFSGNTPFAKGKIEAIRIA